MRIANVEGRLSIVEGDQIFDVEKTSNGQFHFDPQSVYDSWDEFTGWARTADFSAGEPLITERLGSPVPRPRQILAIGLNYGDHASESGFAAPEDMPPVFTKFVSSITGPVATVELPTDGHTDWEVELVAVVGKAATGVDPEDAWDYIAGLTIGQDISERKIQLAGPVPQFSLGKSFPNFTPLGPVLVTVDEFANPDDLGLSCSINDEVVQDGRTSKLIFSIPELVSRLSNVLTLLPGDIIFTGTPAGVGLGRNPQRWLQDGDVLTSRIEGIGTMTQRFVTRG